MMPLSTSRTFAMRAISATDIICGLKRHLHSLRSAVFAASVLLMPGKADAVHFDVIRGAWLSDEYVSVSTEFPEFSILRMYDSSREKDGPWGRGYCSFFSMSLRFSDKSHIVFDTCVNGEQVYKIVSPTRAVLISQPTAHITEQVAAAGGLRSILTSNASSEVLRKLSTLTILRDSSGNVIGYRKDTPRMQLIFDSMGRFRMTGFLGKNGQRSIEATYTNDGDVRWLTIAENLESKVVITPVYDNQHHIIKISSSEIPNTIEYKYNSDHQISQQNTSGKLFIYNYINLKLVSEKAPNGDIREFAYDSRGHAAAFSQSAAKATCTALVRWNENDASIRSSIIRTCGEKEDQWIFNKTEVDGLVVVEPFDPSLAVDYFSCAITGVSSCTNASLYRFWCNCPSF